MTVEEALAASVVEPVNDIFEIDPETRVITVPASEKLFGVANDGNSERKHFRCPKIVGDNIDLSTMHLYINYQNANGQKYPYLVEKWEAGKTYAVGKRLEYNGTIYKVLTAHTSQADWIPPDAPSLFAKVLIPDTDTIPEWEQPGSTNPYAKGDKVTHNGKTWISTADGNVWEPGVYGWEEV